MPCFQYGIYTEGIYKGQTDNQFKGEYGLEALFQLTSEVVYCIFDDFHLFLGICNWNNNYKIINSKRTCIFRDAGLDSRKGIRDEGRCLGCSC